MPLPPLDCGCEPCCRNLFHVAERLKDAAYDAVADCLGENCCDDFHGYVSHGPTPSNPQGDYVTVWLNSVIFAPEPRRDGSFSLMIPRPVFGIKLLESGYPMIQSAGGVIITPSPDEINHASKHIMGHAEAMLRAIVNIAQQGELTCSPTSYQNLSPLEPLQPQGGMVGYQFFYTMQVDW